MLTENEMIDAAVERYFENATGSRSENQEQIQEEFRRWGDAFVICGFDQIVWKLEKAGFEQSHGMGYRMSQEMLNRILYATIKVNLKALSDIVSIWGSKAGEHLASIAAVNPVEDSRSLMAYMLATEYVDSFSPMNREITKLHFKAQYNGLIGTSVKLSYSWALHILGDSSYFEAFVNKNIWEESYKDMIDQFIDVSKPGLLAKDKKLLKFQTLAVPDKTEYAQYFSEGIREVLALDIASCGRAFHNPEWNRKAVGYNFLIVRQNQV
jgi:hypothetical protein